MSRVSEGLEEGGSRPICRFTSLAVFCGSSMGNRPEFKEAAVALGKELAMRNIRLVYGGAEESPGTHGPREGRRKRGGNDGGKGIGDGREGMWEGRLGGQGEGWVE